VERWQRERLIGTRQATAILAHYGLRTQAAERAWRVGRLASIVAILGAILVGVGIILLIASNRQDFDLPRGLKVALIMGTTLFLYALGYVLSYEAVSGRASHHVSEPSLRAAVFPGARSTTSSPTSRDCSCIGS
jgi:uncharacterized membrane protein